VEWHGFFMISIFLQKVYKILSFIFLMKTGIKVGSVMTRNFVSLPSKSTLFQAIDSMYKQEVGSLIVEDKQNLKGIITHTDIIKAIAQRRALDESIDKLMTKKVFTIGPEKDLYDAMIYLRKNKIRWLPVMSNKKVIGLLTLKDILKIQPELFDIVVQNIEIAEEKEKRNMLRYVDDYQWVREGPCEECGVYDLLYKVGNKHYCADCRRNLKN
jgi:signal-transduction protein with cAMP-binding, CBS, and nucleotidyltransferase domain